jgi:hypothetical protein
MADSVSASPPHLKVFCLSSSTGRLPNVPETCRERIGNLQATSHQNQTHLRTHYLLSRCSLGRCINFRLVLAARPSIAEYLPKLGAVHSTLAAAFLADVLTSDEVNLRLTLGTQLQEMVRDLGLCQLSKRGRRWQHGFSLMS